MKKHLKVRYVLLVLFLLTMVTSVSGQGGGFRRPGGAGGFRPFWLPRGPAGRAKIRPLAVKPIRATRPPVTRALVKSPKPPAFGQQLVPHRPTAEVVELRGLARARNWTALRELVAGMPLPETASPEIADALPGVREQSGNLEALQRLWRAVGDRTKLPGADTLEPALAKLGPDDRAYVRKYLVCRALREGQGDLAHKAQPAGQPPDAPTILRDLQAVADKPPAAPPPTALPFNLGPEGPRISPRPQVRKKLGDRLPVLEEELLQVELRARTQVRARIEVAGSKAWHLLNIHLHRLGGHHTAQMVMDHDEEKDAEVEAEVEAEVRKQLGRPLEPAERVLVLHLHVTKTPAELAEILKR
jgi:hypothetical protein